jgi:predicted ATP-dependent serine protease
LQPKRLLISRIEKDSEIALAKTGFSRFDEVLGGGVLRNGGFML